MTDLKISGKIDIDKKHSRILRVFAQAKLCKEKYMFKKVVKKVVCGALALSSVLACAGTMTACETKNPEVKMTVEFNGETYTLKYKLYRKIAPQTTKHFLALADEGYYDGMCIHDFDESANKMYTGGYLYSEDDDAKEFGGLKYVNYFDIVDSYKSFPESVWMDEARENPTYTLTGEFEKNIFEVENGDLAQTFGSLTMYYHSKDTEARVWAYPGAEDYVQRDYSYNSATSMFYITLSETSSNLTEYCTFAKLKKGSKDNLQDLLDAIEEYKDANYTEEESFTTDFVLTVDSDDPLVGDNPQDVTYSVPNEPIIIKSIKVTKW